MKNHNNIDCLYTKEVVCPYCGHEFSDSWEWDNSEDDIYCDNCDNTFAMERNIEVTYCSYKKQEGSEINGKK